MEQDPRVRIQIDAEDRGAGAAFDRLEDLGRRSLQALERIAENSYQEIADSATRAANQAARAQEQAAQRAAAAFEREARRTTAAAEREARNQARAAERAAQDIANSYQGIATAIAISLAGIGAIGNQILQIGGEAEQAAISFEVLLGSVQKATQTLAELRQFADVTPFDTATTVQAAKGLAAFGVAQKDLLPTLKVLGDVSAGSGKNLRELGTIFGQVKTAGRLMTQDLNQFTEAGIPIIGQLAKGFKVSESAIRKMAEQGKISFAAVQQAFIDMTSKGGIFFNLMAKQSESVLGKISTLVSGFQNLAIAVFEASEGPIKSIINTLISVTKAVENFSKANPEAVAAIAATAAGLTALLGVVGLVAAGMALLTAAGPAMGAAFAGIVVPVLAVGAALAALYAAYQQNVGGIQDLIKAATGPFADAFQEASRTVANLARDLGPVLGPILERVGTLLATLAGRTISTLINAFTAALRAVSNFATYISRTLNGDIRDLQDGFTNTLGVIRPVTDAVGQLFGALSTLGNLLGSVVVGAFNAVVAVVRSLTSVLAPVLIPAMQSVGVAFQAIVSVVKIVVIGLTQLAVDTVATLIKGFTNIVRFINGILIGAFEVLNQAVGKSKAAIELLYDVMSGSAPTDALDTYTTKLKNLEDQANASADKMKRAFNGVPPAPQASSFPGIPPVASRDPSSKLPPAPPRMAITDGPPGTQILKPPGVGTSLKGSYDITQSEAEAKAANKRRVDAERLTIKDIQDVREAAAVANVASLKRRLNEEQAAGSASAKQTQADLVAAEVAVLAVRLQTVERMKGIKGQENKDIASLTLQGRDIERQIQEKGADAASAVRIQEAAQQKSILESQTQFAELNAQRQIDIARRALNEAKALNRSREDAATIDYSGLEKAVADREAKLLGVKRASIEKDLANESLANDRKIALRLKLQSVLNQIEQRAADAASNRLTTEAERERAITERKKSLAIEELEAQKRLDDQKLASAQSLRQQELAYLNTDRVTQAQVDAQYKLQQLERERLFLQQKLEILKASGLAETAEYRRIQQELALIGQQYGDIQLDNDAKINAAKRQITLDTAQATADAFGAAGNATGISALNAAEVVIRSLISVAQAAQAITAVFDPVKFLQLGIAIAGAFSAISNLNGARGQLAGGTTAIGGSRSTATTGTTTGQLLTGGGGSGGGGGVTNNYYNNFGGFTYDASQGSGGMGSQASVQQWEQNIVRRIVAELNRTRGNPIGQQVVS